MALCDIFYIFWYRSMCIKILQVLWSMGIYNFFDEQSVSFAIFNWEITWNFEKSLNIWIRMCISYIILYNTYVYCNVYYTLVKYLKNNLIRCCSGIILCYSTSTLYQIKQLIFVQIIRLFHYSIKQFFVSYLVLCIRFQNSQSRISTLYK